MPEAEAIRWLNQGALVVMAAAFLWLVKSVVGDVRHRIDDLLTHSKSANETLSRVEEAIQRMLETLERIERNGRRP